MAIPWDPTQHIQGIAAGLKDAQPGIQAAIDYNKPGDPIYEQFLNEYQRRRAAGEPKEQVHTSLLNDFAKWASAPNNVPAAVPPTVGVQNGNPTLGPAGGLNTPYAQPPNSYPNAPQQPTQQPQVPMAPQQPGLQAAAAAPSVNGINQAAHSATVGAVNPPNPQMAGVDRAAPINYPSGINATLPGHGYEQISGITPEDANRMDQNPIDYPYETKSGTVDRAKPMQTAVGQSPMPKYRTLGQQKEQMKAIADVESLDIKRGTLDAKQAKLEQDKIFKSIAALNEMKKGDRNYKLRLEALSNQTEGMDAEQQRFVVKMWLEKEKMALDAELGHERNRVAGAAVAVRRKVGEDKIPPQLNEARRLYFEAKDKVDSMEKNATRYSLPDQYKKHTNDAANARESYNRLAKMYGWPPIDKDGTVPDRLEEEPTQSTEPAQPSSFLDQFFGKKE